MALERITELEEESRHLREAARETPAPAGDTSSRARWPRCWAAAWG